MEQLTSSNLLATLAVILIVLEGISVISKGVDAWKKLTGRDERVAEMMAIKERLTGLETWKTSVEKRLERGNKRFDDSQKDTTEILKTLRRIVKHLQSGNDHEKLQETDDKLYEYLVERGVSPQQLE